MKNLYLTIIIFALASALMASAGTYIVVESGGRHLASSAAASELSRSPITDDRNAVINAVKKVSPSVVYIDTKVSRKSSRGSRDSMERFIREFFGNDIPFQEYEERTVPSHGTASGVIISADGYILTNDHVVRGADEITVTLNDKKQFKGIIKGSDRVSDIALVKIDASNLPVARLGDSDKVEVGEWVIAVGNPYGYDNTVTVGVISGRKRNLSDGSKEYQDLLQTDAAINPGNSGGPLVNLNGEVIGINTAIIPFAQGIGFAIPVNAARKIEAQLQAQGKVVRPYVGIYMQDIDDAIAGYLRLPFKKGVLISAVMQDSPAASAGIRKGDVVLEVDGKKVEAPDEFRRIIQSHGIGDAIRVLIWRSGKQEAVSLKVGEMPQ
ncbi:MAG: S1C family serine protease [Vulcanimicrobiota bacterium]